MITPDEFQALLESPEVNPLACGRPKAQFRRNSSRNRLIEGCLLAGIKEGQPKRNA